MTNYVGFCFPSGGLMSAVLVRQEPDGKWAGVAGHLSSNQMYAEYDVARHYQDRKDPHDDDVIDWYGCIENQAQMLLFEAKYPPAVQPDE